MAKVRQLADLFLRGALANETMKHLTPKQKALAEQVCERIVKHEALQGHKNMFLTKLGTTIKCDYTDRIMAKQEYRITIWRGVIYLLYHREYSFQCAACEATAYRSQRGKMIKIDRRWVPCPSCKCCIIDDPGDSDHAAGDFISSSDHENLLLEMAAQGRKAPTIKSCVTPIPGKKKIPSPEKILNDPVQIKKFFGEFIWNYFRQTLNENHIAKHGRKTQQLSGPVDAVVVQWITSWLTVHKVTYQCDPFETVDGYYAVYFQPYHKEPEFYQEFLDLVDFATERGGEIILLPTAFLVKDLYGSGQFVSLDVAINEQVQVTTNSISTDEDDEHVDLVQQLEKPNMLTNEHDVDGGDTVKAVRAALPDGDCQRVLDLMTTTGDTYERFSEMYPEQTMANHGIPRQNKMAEFLGCSPKDIKRYRQTIQTTYLAIGIG